LFFLEQGSRRRIRTLLLLLRFHSFVISGGT
jgi:hypothetical protein